MVLSASAPPVADVSGARGAPPPAAGGRGSIPPEAVTRADRRAYVLKKLHSLSGVVPVGVFFVEHLWTNAKALQGEEAFTHAVADIQALPYLPLIEIFGIFLPLAFHAFYGIILAFQSKPNVKAYSYARNWLYVLQRASGLVAFVFIGYHLYEYRIQKWLFGMQSDAFYGALSSHLSSTQISVPWLALAYLVGILAASFHFANGLWGVLFSWGVTVTRTSQRRSAYACAAIGIALFILGANTVLYFATGTRFYLPSDIVTKGQAAACGPSSPGGLGGIPPSPGGLGGIPPSNAGAK
jgi:succinate dehydrogenase/fumarate reductase cytochrome b subunit (b558 family)